jgi:Rieske Fe-S protein
MAPRPTGAPSGKKGRRRFLTLLFIVGSVLSLTPFVPYGQFMSASLQGASKAAKQKVVIDNTSAYGNAAGKPVNVKDLRTFPSNSNWVITYPSSGDATLDSQNANTFVKFELIRLPDALGGGKPDASAFVAFSKLCVHLWCSPNYNPAHQLYECPCHGSAYEVKAPVGLAVLGPASIQPAPTNAIPILKLSSDSAGQLYIEPPIWDINDNGVLGYGRALPGSV